MTTPGWYAKGDPVDDVQITGSDELQFYIKGEAVGDPVPLPTGSSTNPTIATIKDTNGDTVVAISGVGGTVDRWLQLQNGNSSAGAVQINVLGAGANGILLLAKGPITNYAATGTTAVFGGSGPDTNHGLNLTSKGSGTVQANGAPVVTAIIVSTGSETRPAGNGPMLWIGGTTQPTNIGADDVWLPTTSEYPPGIPFIPDFYHRLSTFDTGAGAGALTDDQVAGVPFIAGRTSVITEIGLKIASAGSSGSVIRFGIWQLDGLTATLVADFGTAAATSTGVTLKTGTAPIVAGRKYFAAACSQGHPTTKPQVQYSAYMKDWNPQMASFVAGNLFTANLYQIISTSATGSFASGTLGGAGDLCPALIAKCAT